MWAQSKFCVDQVRVVGKGVAKYVNSNHIKILTFQLMMDNVIYK